MVRAGEVGVGVQGGGGEQKSGQRYAGPRQTTAVRQTQNEWNATQRPAGPTTKQVNKG